MKYDFQQIEQRWQDYWATNQTFHAPNPDEAIGSPPLPKFYVLDMFPYPSGVGLHVGHPLGYIATDIVGRYQRMRGYNVLHPMGFDAFGLPAEQFAVETGVHPKETTRQNIDNMVRQLKRLGLGYDWERRLATTDPDYYKWTQWIFLQLYNSWFDPTVGGTGAARPISELRRALENTEYYVGLDGELIHAGAMEDLGPVAGHPMGGRQWSEMDDTQQRALLNEYRLAYLAHAPVNWCPALGTVLANEEVTADGRSERGNHPVYKRPLKQWMLRITAYAPRLLEDLELVDWPEPIKLMQRNWIGRSEGAEVTFALDEDGHGHLSARAEEEFINVFTTRPDTLFGATYMVLAPEHPLVEAITTADQYHAVNEYIKRTAAQSDVDRETDAREKTGVFTGAYAINPVNEERIPIWIADYVMMGYGTGAIMAVPAHDERDFAFAKRFDLQIKHVVVPESSRHGHFSAREEPHESKNTFVGEGVNVNSANEDVSLDGLATPDAKRRITDWLEDKGLGRGTVQYKLRDWLFSRQRYWGEPFPILHGPNGEILALDESELPVELPPMEDFRPHAAPEERSDEGAGNAHGTIATPLSRAPDSWKYVERDGITYTRELNTMPQWAGSCWYYLRFMDPHNKKRFVGEDAEHYWMRPPRSEGAEAPRGRGKQSGDESEPLTPGPINPLTPRSGVDLYVGGAEHAVLHLLYARFWHKVLYDLSHVSTPEPFGRLFNQGYIQAHAYTDARGVYVPATDVQERDGQFFHEGQPVRQEFGKMGKSLKNAVTPDEMCDQYGADTLRLYEMYMGPLEQSKVWNTRDVLGPHRFLQRLWRNLINEETGEVLIDDTEPDDALLRLTHRTIQRVTRAMETLSFNVAIAALIELNNKLVGLERVPRWTASVLVRLLSPMAPHLSEELWTALGHEPTIADSDWPTWNPDLLIEDEVEYPVQINGKLRGKIVVPADADNAAVEAAARSDAKIAASLEGKTIRNAIVVKGRLVNLVVG